MHRSCGALTTALYLPCLQADPRRATESRGLPQTLRVPSPYEDPTVHLTSPYHMQPPHPRKLVSFASLIRGLLLFPSLRRMTGLFKLSAFLSIRWSWVRTSRERTSLNHKCSLHLQERNVFKCGACVTTASAWKLSSDKQFGLTYIWSLTGLV